MMSHKWLLIALVLAFWVGLGIGTAWGQDGTAYAEIGTGFNRNLFGCHEEHCWNDSGAGALGAYTRVGYEREVRSNVLVGAHWVHLSQWFEGCPQNCADAESSVDHIGLYVRLEW